MTDNTPIDEATAQQALTDLEQAAIDGEPVTPAQLAEARERVTLAGLWRKGQEIRAERAKRKEHEAARAQAKQEAARILANERAELEAAEEALEAAITRLSAAVEAHNNDIQEAARLFKDASIPHAVTWAPQADLLDVPGLDRDNHTMYTPGFAIGHLTVDGKRHHSWDTRTTLHDALTKAVSAQHIARTVSIDD